MFLKSTYKLLKTTLPLFLLYSISYSQSTETRTDIYSIAQFEQQFTKSKTNSELAEELNSESFWIYSSLPSITLGSKKLFTALEIDLLKKDIFQNRKKLNDGIFQRYGLFVGLGLIKSQKQKSAVYAGGGITTDNSKIEHNSQYFHLIYDHHWLISSKFEFGMGILLSYNSGSWKDPHIVNLLPTVKWFASPKLNILISWDNLKVKRYLTSEITGVMEIKYDMSFFKITYNESIFFENVSIGTGLDVKLFNNFYMQIRYKEQIYNNDYIVNTNNNIKLNYYQSSGRALALSIVYAK